MERSGRLGRWAVMAVVGLHTLLLAAYTFPTALVPGRLRALGQAYASPLFHQQWKLFAPDPPSCACAIEHQHVDGRWSPLGRHARTGPARRSIQAVARYVQAEVHAGRREVSAPMREALRRILLPGAGGPGDGRPAPRAPRFRLVERCITDPAHPWAREERITPLHLP